jgi:hypothetical protein
MTAINAPLAVGQLVTAREDRDCCPACGSGGLEFQRAGSTGGVFACLCGESCIRSYDAVIAVDAPPASPYEIAAQYAPVAGPQEQETRRYARPEVREQALRAALTGVQFGGWDERMIAWMTAFDDDICRAVVSWIVRGRQAGPLDGAR